MPAARSASTAIDVRDALAGEFAGVYSRETIERYSEDSLDLIGDARINVFVPVLRTASRESG